MEGLRPNIILQKSSPPAEPVPKYHNIYAMINGGNASHWPRRQVNHDDIPTYVELHFQGPFRDSKKASWIDPLLDSQWCPGSK